MTMHWPRQSTACSKRKSFIVAAHGGALKPSNTPPSNGLTGSTIAACWNQSEISRQQKPKQTSMLLWKDKTWPHNLNQTASSKTGAVHPWTNGQVERMNRTIKEATVKRFHYDDHAQLKRHLADFIDAFNFGRRLKTPKGLTPYEFICKQWTLEQGRFIINPVHQMPGLPEAGPEIAETQVVSICRSCPRR